VFRDTWPCFFAPVSSQQCIHACSACLYINIHTCAHSQWWSSAGISASVAVERALKDSCTMGRTSPSATQLMVKLHGRVSYGKQEEREAMLQCAWIYCIIIVIIGSGSVAANTGVVLVVIYRLIMGKYGPTNNNLKKNIFLLFNQNQRNSSNKL